MVENRGTAVDDVVVDVAKRWSFSSPKNLAVIVSYATSRRDTAPAVLQQWLNYDRHVATDLRFDAQLDTLGRVGTAMADGVRRQILVRLIDGSAYPAELADELGESRANISNHLACLRGCGLVRATREGRQMRYDLTDRKLAQALKLLGEITLAVEAGHADLDGRS